MSELRECPFPTTGIVHVPRVITAVGESWVLCTCGASGPMFSDVDGSGEQKAIEAWNTRAERTCIPHVEPRTFTGDTEPSFYQAICDCGWVVGEDGASSLSDFEHVDNYCGGCGVKIERGES